MSKPMFSLFSVTTQTRNGANMCEIEIQADKNIGKTWVFTINNYTETEYERVKLWDVKRLAMGKEVAPETGTPHLQGYVTFPRAMRLAALKKLAPTAHWEVAKVLDWNYSLKLDSTDVFTKDNTKQGKRRDIDAAYDAVLAKKSRRDYFAENKPSYQAWKVFEVASLYLREERPIAPIEVIWIYGETGTGKTRAAYDIAGPDRYVVRDFKWWDGYDRQSTIIIDEVRRDFCKFAEWLTLLDIYPLRKQTKGGWVETHFKRVIITSAQSPQEMWENYTEGEDMKQLMRRISSVRRYQNTPLGVTVTEVREGNTGLPGPAQPVVDLTAEYECCGYGGCHVCGFIDLSSDDIPLNQN